MTATTLRRVAGRMAGEAWRLAVTYLPESLLVLAMLAAWGLFAYAVQLLALAYVPGAAPAVWPLMSALLLASGAGWKMLKGIAKEGLYALSRGEDA